MKNIYYFFILIILFFQSTIFGYCGNDEICIHNYTSYDITIGIYPVSMIFNGNGMYNLIAKGRSDNIQGAYPALYDYLNGITYIDSANIYVKHIFHSIPHNSGDAFIGWNDDLSSFGNTNSEGSYGFGIYKLEIACYDVNGFHHIDSILIDIDYYPDADRFNNPGDLNIALYDRAHSPFIQYLFDRPEFTPVNVTYDQNQVTIIKYYEPEGPNTPPKYKRPKILGPINQNGFFEYKNETGDYNLYTEIPLDCRLYCNLYLGFNNWRNQNHVFPFLNFLNNDISTEDIRQGILSMNLSITKSVSTPIHVWRNNIYLPDYYTVPIIISPLCTLKISNNANLTLNHSTDADVDKSFFMTNKSGGYLDIENGSLIKINPPPNSQNIRSELDLEYQSNYIGNGNAEIQVYPGGQFCNYGANISGNLRVRYMGGRPFPYLYCSQPFYVSHNTEIILDSSDLQIPDSLNIILDGDSSSLFVNSSSSIQFGSHSSITLQNGAHLYADNATFTSTDAGTIWNGIIINNSIGDTITNCTFNNAIVSLSISDTGMAAGNKELIRGNVFNASTDNTQSNYGIYASNLLNATIDQNTFNMQSSANNSAIYFENSDNSGYNQTNANLNITNNTFNGGGTQVFLNCLASAVTPFYIAGNTFTGLDGNNCKGFWAKKITGSFKNNSFSNEYYQNDVSLYQSNLYILNNHDLKSNSGSCIDVTHSSTAQIAPLLNTSGYLEWYGGMNTIYSYYHDNVYFNNGSYAQTDLGQNCFNLTDSNSHYHIDGILNTHTYGNNYSATQNYWNTSTPQISIYDINSNQFIYSTTTPTYPSCSGNNLQFINYIIVDRGDGIIDSTLVTSNYNSGGSLDGMLYSQSISNTRTGNFTGAVSNLETLLNNYDTSIYLMPSIDRLYLNYQYLDSTANLSHRIALFSSLRDYLEAKITQHQTDEDFVIKAYDGYLMCLTKVTNFTEAIAGYENIMNNSPDTLRRLFASWDRATVILLMNGGGGGTSPYLSKGEEYEKILSKKPIHELVKEIFTNQRNAVQKMRSDKREAMKNNMNVDNSRINSRITKFNPSNHKELHQKIAEDMVIVSGSKYTPKSNVKNNVPRVFNLYQNYPNPFNPVTKIKYDLPVNESVTIKIYDILGREVAVLVNNEYKEAGTYQIEWNGVNYASGVYFYRIEAGQYTNVKKMVLVK